MGLGWALSIWSFCRPSLFLAFSVESTAGILSPEAWPADLLESLPYLGICMSQDNRNASVSLQRPWKNIDSSRDRPPSLDNLVAFGGKVPVGEVVGLLSGGGSLTSIISLLTPLELGVRKNVNLANDPADVQISLSADLQNNARCRFGNVPDRASVFCISAGDWSGENGTGRLFPMGLATMDWNTISRGGNAGRELSLTTVRDAGDFDGIGYLGAVIAFFPDADDAPAGLGNAVSARLDRNTLTAMADK